MDEKIVNCKFEPTIQFKKKVIESKPLINTLEIIKDEKVPLITEDKKIKLKRFKVQLTPEDKKIKLKRFNII